MMFVLCPACETRVEVLPDAYGSERTDLYNVSLCPECGTSFDYDDEEVQFERTDDPPTGEGRKEGVDNAEGDGSASRAK